MIYILLVLFLIFTPCSVFAFSTPWDLSTIDTILSTGQWVLMSIASAIFVPLTGLWIIRKLIKLTNRS